MAGYDGTTRELEISLSIVPSWFSLISRFHQDLSLSHSASLVYHEFEVFSHQFVAHDFPLRLIPHREVGVSLEWKIPLHEGDVHSRRLGQGDLVNLRSAG